MMSKRLEFLLDALAHLVVIVVATSVATLVAILVLDAVGMLEL